MPEQLSKNRKRRGRGEASIFQREEDGLWVGTVSLGYDGNGKRIRKTVYAPTKREVQDKLDELRSDARVGMLPGASGMTVGQLLDQWLKTTEPKTAARTHEERQRIVKNHLKPRLGGARLDRLTALYVEGLYADMHRDKVGPFAVRSAADQLSIALNYAVRLRLIPANPAKAVDKPRLPKREPTFLTADQAKRLLVAAGASNLSALVALALGSGMRQGELLALGWEDIDTRAGTVTVRKALTQTKAAGFALKEPKTAASRRTVALPAFAVDALTAHKTAALKAGVIASPVFCTRTGNYLDKKNVLRAFRGIVKRANRAAAEADAKNKTETKPIPDRLRFHDLRHSVASLLLSTGHSLRAVSQRLGHANPTMTLRVYGHVMPGDDAKLAAGLNALMA